MRSEVTSLSFFADPVRLVKKNNMRIIANGSSLIRAIQIAEYLGAKYNPQSGYENDVCIYVKPSRRAKFQAKSYIDIVDKESLIPLLQKNSHIPAITSSEYGFEYLKKILKQEVVLIPQQHCNFERVRREKRPVKVVGIHGVKQSIQYPIEKIKERLESMGLEFFMDFSYRTREDIVDFYKKIDIQLVLCTMDNPLKQALKIWNAASFGIPTVGYPQLGYKEAEGYYIRASNDESFINEIQKLAESASEYDSFSEKIINASEKYHIKNVAEFYKKLGEKT